MRGRCGTVSALLFAAALPAAPAGAQGTGGETPGGGAKTSAFSAGMPENEGHRGMSSQSDIVLDVPLGGTDVVGHIGVSGSCTDCFGFRWPHCRRWAAAKLGGSDASESAVDAALGWLSRSQEPDGGWSVVDQEGTPGEDDNENVTATGLALLAFLGAGHTDRGEFRICVARAVQWLVSRQDSEGGIGQTGLAHAVAGLALAEALGLRMVSSTVRAAKRAAECSIEVHRRRSGGCGDWPGAPPNTAVTAWFVMQLRSARTAGLEVDPEVFRGATAFLDRVTVMEGGSVGGCSLRPHRPHDPAMTAACLLARQFAGGKRENPLLIGAANYLMKNLPKWEKDGVGVDFRYWHFGTLAMFQMGGDWWRSWNWALRDMLVARQVRNGQNRGSWDPAGPWCRGRGRVFSTALAALTLEVYYRYLPIYK